jgi:hypothetical protein
MRHCFNNVDEAVEISCCGFPRQFVGPSEFDPFISSKGRTLRAAAPHLLESVKFACSPSADILQRNHTNG